MINENMKKIAKAMIDEELARALKEHGEFHSLHEGYAVMREEFDELEIETEMLGIDINMAWGSVKRDDYESLARELTKIRSKATHAICEAAQLGAMAEKLLKIVNPECVDDIDSWAKRKSERISESVIDDIDEAVYGDIDIDERADDYVFRKICENTYGGKKMRGADNE